MPGRVETVLPEPWIRGLDITEYLANGANSSLYTRRGTWPDPEHILNNAGGGGAAGTPWVPQVFGGAWWWRGVSGANSSHSRHTTLFQWPVGRDWSTLPADGRSPMEYTFEGVLVRQGSVNNTPWQFGLYTTVAPINIGTYPGMVVFSNPGVFANWQVMRRARDLGLLVTVDTGIPLADPLYAQLRYRDTDNPRIVMLLNGVEFGAAEGLANVPQMADGSTTNWNLGSLEGHTAGVAAGQVFRLRQVRMIAQELPGYE